MSPRVRNLRPLRLHQHGPFDFRVTFSGLIGGLGIVVMSGFLLLAAIVVMESGVIVGQIDAETVALTAVFAAFAMATCVFGTSIAWWKCDVRFKPMRDVVTMRVRGLDGSRERTFRSAEVRAALVYCEVPTNGFVHKFAALQLRLPEEAPLIISGWRWPLRSVAVERAHEFGRAVRIDVDTSEVASRV